MARVIFQVFLEFVFTGTSPRTRCFKAMDPILEVLRDDVSFPVYLSVKALLAYGTNNRLFWGVGGRSLFMI